MSAIRRITIHTVLLFHILFSTYSAIIQTAQRNSSSKKISDSRIIPDQSLFSITYFTIEMVGGQMLISQYEQLLGGGGHNQDSYNNAAKVVNIEYYTNNSNTKQIPYIIPYKEQNSTDQQNKTNQLPPQQPKPVIKDNDTEKKFLVYGPDWTTVQYVNFNNSTSSTNKSNLKNNTNINGSLVANTSINLNSSKNNSNINVSLITNTTSVHSFNNSIVTTQNSSRIASATSASSTNNVTIITSSSSSSSTSTIVSSSSTNSSLNITSIQRSNFTNTTSTNITIQNNHNTSTNSSNNQIVLLNMTNEEDTKQQILSDLASQSTNIISFFQPLFYVRPIINSQFKNVGFYHEVPLQYYDGEVYLFWGIITNKDIIQQKLDNPIGVVLMFLERNTSRQFQCVDESLNGIQFNISCRMSRPGSYFIYVFVSNSAQASNVVRQINKAQKMIKYDAPISNIPQPQGLRVQVVNNSLYVAWDSRANITNLTIYQEDGGFFRKKQYILSNNHERFKVPYNDFEGFLPMKTFVQISHAMYVDGSFSKFTPKISQISFEALDHAFDFSQSQKLQFSSDLPWKLNVGEEILINITFKEQTQSTIYITEPSLKINRLIFINQEPLNAINKNYFRAGTILPLRLQFSQTGTHFLTVYNANGVAILNQPLYIGPGYPLIPDYKDLTPKHFDINRFNKSYEYIYQNYYSRRIEKLTIRQPSKNDTIYSKRSYLFLLINGFRRKLNLKMFQFDEELNKIAQNHTDDMILRNFFGDISPEGQTLENRVAKFNFTRSISQTILKSTYLTQNYLQLERSATDLENILNKISLVIGIGINMTADNKYVVTYLFSTRNFLKNILLPEEIQQIKQQLIDIIKQKNPNVVNQNKIISDDIQTWMQSKRSQIIFKYITDKRGFKLISGFVSKTTFNDSWADKFRNDNKLNGFSKATYVSIGIQPLKQENTIYQIYVLFS